MIARRALLVAAGLAVASPAFAQIALYADRLPDGFAYVRFANATTEAMELKPDFTDPVKLGTDGPARISPYRVVENVAGKKLTVAAGGGTLTLQLEPGKFHTYLLTGAGAKLAGTLITDVTDYSQQRVKLSFYNATTDCAAAGLLLEPKGQAIFSGLAPASMKTRSTNPVESAKVRATCGLSDQPVLDLGELNAGALYSVWLMAPSGTPVTFMAQDSITAYQK